MVLSLFKLIFVISPLWISVIPRSNYFMIVTCPSTFISSSNKTSFPFLLTFRPFVLPPYFASLFPTFLPSFFPSFLPSTRLSNLFHPSILFYFLPSFLPFFFPSFLPSLHRSPHHHFSKILLSFQNYSNMIKIIFQLS